MRSTLTPGYQGVSNAVVFCYGCIMVEKKSCSFIAIYYLYFMDYSILIEKITDSPMPENYYYAHIPALDLTTHGEGVDGAKQAAKDLIQGWITEKLANHESVPKESESYFSKITIDDAILSA